MFRRWDPFQELHELSETFDRFFNRFWSDQPWSSPQWVGDYLPLDIVETDENYLVKASIPGLNPDDLEITFSNNVLTIKGEVKPDWKVDQPCYHLKERWHGPFQRSLTLPENIVADDIQANYEAGVLTVVLPKSAEARPKRIQIQAGVPSKMLEESTVGTK